MADDDQKVEETASDAQDAKDEAQAAAGEAKAESDSAKNSAADAQKAEEKAESAAQTAEKAEDKTQAAVSNVKEIVQEAKAEEPKAQVKVSKKLGEIIGEIEKLSVLELSELVKALETKFGVTAAAPMAVAAGGGAAAGAADEGVSEQTTFNVILADGGANKISVIKAVREIVPTLGLKEAKDLVDGAPKPVVEGVNKENAQEAKQKLEAAGAKVELK